MAPRSTLLSFAALVAVSGCIGGRPVAPTPTQVPPGTSPREAVLGRPPTETDCFETVFEVITVPDGPTLERHLVTAPLRPAWLPSRGFVGTPAQLARAVDGQLIESDPQATWVLVIDGGKARADRYFPLTGRTGERVWYRDGSVRSCA